MQKHTCYQNTVLSFQLFSLFKCSIILYEMKYYISFNYSDVNHSYFQNFKKICCPKDSFIKVFTFKNLLAKSRAYM